MLYYQITSQDGLENIFCDELSTNLPFEILGLKIGTILPDDGVFPERQIIKIMSDNDKINNKLSCFARSNRKKLKK